MKDKQEKLSSHRKENGGLRMIIIGVLIVGILMLFITPVAKKILGPDRVVVENQDTVPEIYIEKFINTISITIIEKVQVIGQNFGEDFKIIEYDSTQGDFKLKSRDIVFKLDRTGNYGESIEIGFNYGYDALELSVSRFEKGEYRTSKSDSAVGQFIDLVNTLLKDDFAGTSKIKGSIWGYADATPVISGTEYKGDLGLIQDESFYIRPIDPQEKKILSSKSISKDVHQLKIIDFAFLRAYHLKKFMLNNIKNQVANHNDLVIYATATSQKDTAHRKVEAKFYFEGALKHKLDSLHDEIREQLAERYSIGKQVN